MSFENTSRSRFPRISFISPKNKSKEHKQKKRNKKTVLRSDEIYINLHDEACSQLIFLEHTSRRDFFIALIGDFARGASKKEKKTQYLLFTLDSIFISLFCVLCAGDDFL